MTGKAMSNPFRSHAVWWFAVGVVATTMAIAVLLFIVFGMAISPVDAMLNHPTREHDLQLYSNDRWVISYWVERPVPDACVLHHAIMSKDRAHRTAGYVPCAVFYLIFTIGKPV